MRLAWRQTRAPGHAGVRPRQARARGYQLQRAGPQLARGAFARAVQERTPERTSCSPVQLINLVPAQHARTSRPVTRGPELEDRNGAYLHCSRCVCSAECRRCRHAPAVGLHAAGELAQGGDRTWRACIGRRLGCRRRHHALVSIVRPAPQRAQRAGAPCAGSAQGARRRRGVPADLLRGSGARHTQRQEQRS